MRSLFQLSAFIVASLWPASAAAAQDQCATEGPDYFYEECFQTSVQIPSEVVEAILKTDTGKEGLEELNEDGRKNVARLFRARELNLGPEGEKDLIVIGDGPMSGADNTWFWLVRLLPDHPQVVLWVGANGLQILNSRMNGLKDVQSGWCSAAVCETKIFRYEHGQYECVKTHSKSNR